MRHMRSLSIILGEGIQDISTGESDKFVGMWSPVAGWIEAAVKYCNVDNKVTTALLGLEWKLIIVRGKHTLGASHRCVCEVSMTYPMQTTDGCEVRVPLHTVQFELIDGGLIDWQGYRIVLTGQETTAIKQIAEALSFGDTTLSEGHKRKLHFRRNWFPLIRRLSI